MKLNSKKIVTLSLFAAVMLQGNLSAQMNDKESLGSVDVISSNATENTNSYTIDYLNTATRMNLSVKETPQSITVITSQQIEDMALEDLSDIAKNTTGISVTTNDSERQTFRARGFDIENYQIDGVTTSYSVQWNSGEIHQDLSLFDRVEVVKGSTGLISGAGDPSASINLVRKHANSKELKANLSLEAGSWDKYRTDIDISAPLNKDGTIRGRVVAAYEDKESHLDLYSRKKSILYGVIDADLSDMTRISAGLSFQKNEPKGVTWGGLPGQFSDGSQTNWDVSKTTAANWTEFNFEHINYFANIEHIFKNNIKLYAAYSKTDNSSDSKLLYLFGKPNRITGLGMGAGAGRYEVEREQDNIDVYASFPFETENFEHEILTGLMYNKQDFKAYSYGYFPSVIGNFFKWDGTYSEPTWNAKSLSASSDVTQLGTYAVGRFSLSEKIKLILGTRFTNWKADGISNAKDFSFKHNHVLTPYAGFIYNFNDDYTAYASYSDIFKPQNKQDSSGKYLDPVEGETYELGIKGEFFNDKLNTSLAIFRIEQDNLAQNDPRNVFVPGTKAIASIAAEGVTSKGFEIDVSGEINDKWNLSLGYAQFKAQDSKGKDVNTDNPRKSLRLFTKYRINNLSLGAGVNWQNGLIQTAGNASQGAYSIVNLMAKYKFTKDLSAQVNIDNVFDKKYYSNTSFFGASYGEPRNITFKLKYTF